MSQNEPFNRDFSLPEIRAYFCLARILPILLTAFPLSLLVNHKIHVFKPTKIPLPARLSVNASKYEMNDQFMHCQKARTHF